MRSIATTTGAIDSYNTRRPRRGDQMCPKDDKHHNQVAAIHAPPHASSSSSRRRSRTGFPSPLPATAVCQHRHRGAAGAHGAATLQPAALGSRITATCVLFVCVSGLAWAGLIVSVLGPPAAGSRGAPISLSGNSQIARLAAARAASFAMAARLGDSLPPGWTQLGHHSRFLGQEAFPEQFERWDEEGEVVINVVDVEPLAREGKALPKADIVLAILSKDTEVRPDAGLRVGMGGSGGG